MTVKGTRELVKKEGSGYASPFSEMEKWFDRAWRRPFSLLETPFWPGLKLSERDAISPSVDIYEEGKELVLKADIPGLKKKDLNVDLTDNVLTITGEKKKEEKIERDDYYRYERSHGSFSRKFELPEDVETGKIKAHFEDGVLEIRVPRTKVTEKKHKKISVE
jgi:HSP20 family protein